MLLTMIHEAMAKQRLSLRDAAKQIGISHTTLARTLDNQQMDLDTLIKICMWLKVNPGDAINSQINDGEMLSSKIAVILSRSTKLKDLLDELVRKIEMDGLDPSIIEETFEYIAFKLNLRSTE